MSKRRKKIQPRTVDGVLNPDVNKHEYDLRPNVGQSDNSQGTLFQVTKRPRNTVMHRGFSAARQDDVQRMVDIHTEDAPYLEYQAANLQNTRKKKARQDVTPGSRGQETERAVQDVIARTSGPLLGKLKVNVVGSNYPRLAYHDANGIYEPKDGSILASELTFNPNAGKKGRQWDSITLRHELGHHHQDMTEGLVTRNPMESGKAEAYADDFAITHAPKGTGEGYQFKDYGRHDGMFRSAYMRARKTPVYEHQVVADSPHVVTSGGTADLSHDLAVTGQEALPGEHFGGFGHQYRSFASRRAIGVQTREEHIASTENRQVNGIRKTLGLS